jgi:5'-nucleotidase
MRILLTNDDGIDAPGLQALVQAATQFGRVIVAAPAAAHSGCGHRVTTDAPFAVTEVAAGRFAVAGTPADCVRVALHDLAPGVDWVLSGVNAGGNLGADVYHSGTVAAVREAALHGVRGVALSHYFRRGAIPDWARAARWVLPVLRDLLNRPHAAGTFWNVNLPHLDANAADPRLVQCPIDPSPLPLNFRRDGNLYRYNGDYHGRPRVAGGDVDVCFAGNIAVSLCPLRG